MGQESPEGAGGGGGEGGAAPSLSRLFLSDAKVETKSRENGSNVLSLKMFPH